MVLFEDFNSREIVLNSFIQTKLLRFLFIIIVIFMNRIKLGF